MSILALPDYCKSGSTFELPVYQKSTQFPLTKKKEGLSTSDETIVIENSSVNSHFTIESLRDHLDICRVCSLPRLTRVELEKRLYSVGADKPDLQALCDELNLGITELEDHTERCVLNRIIDLPINKLMSSVLEEVEDFFKILKTYKAEVRANTGAENMQTYANVFREVRLTLQELSGVETPKAQGQNIVSSVLGPYVINVLTDTIPEIKALQDSTLQFVTPSVHNTIKTSFNELVEKLASICKERIQIAKEKLAELLDLNVTDLE